MFQTSVLDVAIGVAFLFLLASLLCSVIQEGIEAVLKIRAMQVERGIRMLLGDPTGALTKELFDHPLIKSLFSGTYSPSNIKDQKYENRAGLPSYIPSASFSAALLDLAARMPAALDSTAAPHPPGQPLTFEVVRNSVAQIRTGNEAVRRALTTALDRAEGDLSAARANVEQWFDATMERVSGWYRRRAQLMLLSIAFLAALSLNIDAIAISRALTVDNRLREEIVKSAVSSTTQGSSVDSLETRSKVTTALENLSAAGFPIGWSNEKLKFAVREADGNTIFTMLAGWLITALAVSMGAPFWFDVLNKFVNLRSTVKPKGDGEARNGGTAKKGDGPAAVGASRGASLPAGGFVPHEWSTGTADGGVL